VKTLNAIVGLTENKPAPKQRTGAIRAQAQQAPAGHTGAFYPPRIAGRELIRAFRAADWPTPDARQAFVEDAGSAESADLLKLLELVTGKRSAAETLKHRERCDAFGRIAVRASDPALFVPFVRALKGGDSVLAKCLAPAIPGVNDVAQQGELCDLLRSEDTRQRELAAGVLKQLGARPALLERLAEMVRERGFPARREVVELVLSTAGGRAVTVLAALLRVRDPRDRAMAVRGLADPRCVEGNTEEALAALALALQDRDERVAVRAVAAFAASCSEDALFRRLGVFLESDDAAHVKAVVAGLGRFGSARSIRALERRFLSGPDDIRFLVLDTLEQIGTDAVVPALVEALANRRLPIRTRAGEVLSRLSRSGKVAIERTIIWLLRSPDVEVRRMAADIASTVDDTAGRFWPSLLRFLRDEDWWVRERVADALVTMAGKQLTAPVVGFLSDPSGVVRRFAIGVLERLRDPDSLGALVRAAQSDPDWWVQERAIEAIAVLRDGRAVPYLLELLGKEPDLRLICVRAVGDMGVTAAAPTVAALLSADDVDVRRAALECLETLRATGQSEAVQARLQDEDPRVRAAARELLVRWEVAGFQQVEPTLLEALSDLDQMLVRGVEAGAEDILVGSGRIPMAKRMGRLLPLAEQALGEEALRSSLMPLLSTAQIEALRGLEDVDLTHELPSHGMRFRAHVYQEQAGIAATFRPVGSGSRDLASLGLPDTVVSLAGLKDGLVVVAGGTGSGKTSTIAALIDHINRTSNRHIVSLEDPIEVVHGSERSLVNQRELGTHTRSFERALHATLRQDADVILAGELRDLATTDFALTAAETGHLVLCTSHTLTAQTTVDRLVNVYPSARQDQARSRLSECLRSTVCQAVLREKEGASTCLAVEVMFNNDAIGSLIRQGKTFQIPSVIATSREQGMQLMDVHLMQLLKAGRVGAEEAYMKAHNKADFESLLEAGQGS